MHPFTRHLPDSVSALGEAKLIAAIRRWLGDVSPRAPFGIGDDCAVLPASRGRQLITVDPVIYGRHFDDTVPPRAVGEKLLKRNLSDIAAMGGRPVAAVLGITLDGRVVETSGLSLQADALLCRDVLENLPECEEIIDERNDRRLDQLEAQGLM